MRVWRVLGPFVATLYLGAALFLAWTSPERSAILAWTAIGAVFGFAGAIAWLPAATTVWANRMYLVAWIAMALAVPLSAQADGSWSHLALMIVIFGAATTMLWLAGYLVVVVSVLLSAVALGLLDQGDVGSNLAVVIGTLIGVVVQVSRIGAFDLQSKVTATFQHLGDIVKSSPDAIISTSADGRIISWNDGAKALHGTPATQAVGSMLADIWPRLAQVPDGEVSIEDGRVMDVQARTTKEGRVIVARDVTERQRLEDLERQHEMAAFRQRLLNAAAHELYTPLTPLTLNLSSLETRLEQGRPIPPETIHRMHRNLRRLQRRVEDMVAAAQGIDMAAHIRPRRTDLTDLLESTLAAFARDAEQTGLGFTSQVPEGLEATVDGDLLAQALSSIMENAIKFTDEGTIDVLVALGDDLIITVTDTGRGFPAEKAEEIFDAFTQVHDTMQNTQSGAGLGLFIARSIVAAHGGTVTGEPLAQGSRFVIRIPCAAIDLKQEQTVEAA